MPRNGVGCEMDDVELVCMFDMGEKTPDKWSAFCVNPWACGAEGSGEFCYYCNKLNAWDK